MKIKRITDFFKLCFNFGNVFGDNFLLKIKITIQVFLCSVYWKLFNNKEFTFNLSFNKVKFTLYLDCSMDLVVFRETFVQQEYKYEYDKDSKIILDLGANIGDTAIYFAIFFPQAKIYSVEPNPNLYEKLQKNTKQFNNIKCYNFAIGKETKDVYFSFGEIHFKGTIQNNSTNNTLVKMYSLTDFVKNENIQNVDILKFDIEGGEDELLQDPFIKTGTKSIVGEIHDGLTSDEISNIIHSLNLKNMHRKQLFEKRYILFGNL